jgi:hypothetical protein
VFRKRWYDLSKLDQNDSNAVQLSQPVFLTITHSSYINWVDFFIGDISPAFETLQIAHLIIECQSIFVGAIIKLLRFLPNLDSLKVRSLSLLKPRCLSKEEVETLRSVSKNNKITKLNLQRTDELAEIQFLIDLCPRMQYFEVDCSRIIDLNSLVRFILMKTTRCIPHLRTVCLCVTEANDKMVEQVQTMINLEKLLHDYTTTYLPGKIYVQWT